jgi:drug/metabolite transporter (DMT)-like permease
VLETRAAGAIPRTRAWGIGLAFATALISGVAVFVNAYGLKRFPSPTSYTTAKNLVAALLLLALTTAATARRSPAAWTPPRRAPEWIGLLVVGVVGGGVAFVLFFEGLARASSPDAAFIHKTLIVWVALLAIPLLGERLGPAHVAAIALLVLGQADLAGSLGDLGLTRGEVMVGAATILWAVEVVIAKHLLSSLSPLTVGVSRMTVGVVVLVGYLGVRGDLAQLTDAGASAWWWALATGAILTGYVVTWFAALARAQAVDVTAVLVFGAVVTAVLDRAFEGTAIRGQWLGLLLITVGSAAIAIVALRQRRPERAPA